MAAILSDINGKWLPIL